MPYDVVEANRLATQTGLALGQAMFNNSLRMQELKSRQAYQQLQEQELAQRLQFQMEAHDQMVQQRANNEKARAAFMVTQTPFLPGPSGQALPNPAYQPDAGKAYLQTMMPYSTDPSGTVLNAAKIQLEQAQAQRALREQNFSPRIVDVPTGIPGESIKFGYTSPNSGQFMPGDIEVTTNEQGMRMWRSGPSDKWKQDVQGAIAARQAAAAQNKQAEVAPDLSVPNPNAPGMRQIPPENFNQFAQRASVTAGTRSNLEQQGINAEHMIENGQKLLSLINSKNLSLPGQLKRVAEEHGLTTIFPSLADPSISALTATGSSFTANVIRGLRSDGNINQNEVNRLESASNTYKWTDPISAKSRIKTFLEQSGRIARESYTKLGKPVPPQYMTYGEIRKLVADHKITDKDGVDLYMNTLDSLVKQIDAEINQ